MSSPESPPDFHGFGLPEALTLAVDEIGYERPSPIQAAVIEPLMAGRDIFGQAQTGTGKTAAFALPLLARLELERRVPQVLVLTPTRELAIQVAEAFTTYARHLPGFRVLPIYGGQPFGQQLKPLERGVHVVVGTPGRVADHLRRGTLDLAGIRSFVLDEADEMLRMGFIDEVEGILGAAPPSRQLALFSATMPEPVKAIARTHAHDPIEVRVESRTSTVETVRQRYWFVSGVHKLDALTRLLETEDFDAMTVFVRTRTATTFLAERLEARGFSAAALSGEMNQEVREQTINRLRTGALDILVATDVAARGLDVERISHVINYDIPYDTEAYVHRIGRTGRAGRAGQAILFVAPRERRMLRTIERATRQTIEPMQLPTHADVAVRRTDRFKARITEVLETEDLGFFESLVQDYRVENDADPDKVAAALAFLAQGRRRIGPEADAGRDAAPAGAAETGSAPRPARRGDSPRPRGGFDDGTADGDGERIRYRIEVGSQHGVQPKNIVGAIANEAGLQSRAIGPIRIHDGFSLVTLPGDVPDEVLEHLKRVWVCGRQLRLAVDDGGPRHGGHDDRRGPPGRWRPDADRGRNDASSHDDAGAREAGRTFGDRSSPGSGDRAGGQRRDDRRYDRKPSRGADQGGDARPAPRGARRGQDGGPRRSDSANADPRGAGKRRGPAGGRADAGSAEFRPGKAPGRRAAAKPVRDGVDTDETPRRAGPRGAGAAAAPGPKAGKGAPKRKERARNARDKGKPKRKAPGKRGGPGPGAR